MKVTVNDKTFELFPGESLAEATEALGEKAVYTCYTELYKRKAREFIKHLLDRKVPEAEIQARLKTWRPYTANRREPRSLKKLGELISLSPEVASRLRQQHLLSEPEAQEAEQKEEQEKGEAEEESGDKV